jgi:hypothetical protein
MVANQRKPIMQAMLQWKRGSYNPLRSTQVFGALVQEG